MLNLYTLLEDLTGTAGVTGAEQDAAETAMAALKPFCSSAVRNDRGSVVGIREGSGPLLLLDAHIDQIGLIVTDYAENGFLRFALCGGTDPRVLVGMEVLILGKKPYFGVISALPPHLQKEEDRGTVKEASDLAIDTGYSEEECRTLFHPGDRCILKSYPAQMPDHCFTAGALDDRAGVAALIRTAELLQERGCTRRTAFLFSVQEEVGGRGASTAAYSMDAEEAIAVDVSFARTPGCTPQEAGILGNGPMIGYSPALDRDLFESLCKTAEKNEIPFQKEIMNGRTGTHADELAVCGGGIRTGLVSIPLKYMHTPCEVISLDDVEQTAQLLAAAAMTDRSGGAA